MRAVGAEAGSFARLRGWRVGLAVFGLVIGLAPAGSAGAAPVPSGAVRPAAATSGGVFVPVTPTRLEDTRSVAGGRLSSGGSVTVSVPTSVVPSGSAAVAVNVTAVGPSSVGNLVAYPAGTTKPATSTVNFDPGRDVANAAIVPLSAQGSLTVSNNSAGSVDVVVDLDGYFTTAAGSGGAGHYYPLTPARIDDTRAGSGQPDAGKTLGAASTLNVQVAGHGGVPATGVAAVVLNLTVTNVTAGADYLSVYPAGGSQPGVSNLNLPAGDTRANRVIVPVSSAGAVTVYNNLGQADVIMDVSGYVSDGTGSASGGNLFTPLAPARALDTRNTATPFSSTPTVTTLAGTAGLPAAGPAGATAAVLNVTEADSAKVTTGSTYLTVYPAGGSAPLASDLNYPPGDTRPNLDVATLNNQGQVAGIVGSGTADVIYDVTGYFSPASSAATTYSVTLSPTSGPPGTVVTGTITSSGASIAARTDSSGVTSVIVNGCGLTNQSEPVSSNNTFTFTIPANAPTGGCAISVTVNGQTTTVPGGYTVTPAATPLSVTTSTLPNGTVGTAYPTTQLTASGGTTPYTWTATGLPAGLTLSSRGVLSGTPTTAGTANVTINVADAAGAAATKTFSLTISPSTAPPTPHETDYLPSFAEGYAISCPSTTDCTAVGRSGGYGALILGTTDGGKTWAVEKTYPGAPSASLTAISCFSTSTCVAGGYNVSSLSSGGFVVRTTDGGATWSAEVSVPAGSVGGISCPSTTVCFAVAQDAYAATSQLTGEVLSSTDGGATWRQQSLPANIQDLYGISCPSTATCTAVGDGANGGGGLVITTANSGVTWSKQTIPANVGGLTAVSCSSVGSCTAVGQFNTGSSGTSVSGAVLATTNGGASWNSETIPSDVETLGGVSCPSAAVCTAVGQSSSSTPEIIATGDGGSSWTKQYEQALSSGSNTDLVAMACPSTMSCFATGVAYSTTTSGESGVLVSTSNGGVSWAPEKVPSGIDTLDGVSCSSTTTCIAVGNNSEGGTVISTGNGGATWVQQAIPADISELAGVSCPSTSTCVAVGNAGDPSTPALLRTTDGGASWVAQAVPSDIYSLSGVACASTADCLVVGASSNSPYVGIIRTTDGGATWSESAVPSGVSGLSDVSCPSATTCLAVGDYYTSTGGAQDSGVVIATTDGGVTWATQMTPASVGYNSVSCSTVSDCVASGYDNNGSPLLISTSNGGTNWTQRSLPSGTTTVGAVSCARDGGCSTATLGSGGAVILRTTDGGATFTSDTTLPAALSFPISLSCQTGGVCAAVTENASAGASAYVYQSP